MTDKEAFEKILEYDGWKEVYLYDGVTAAVYTLDDGTSLEFHERKQSCGDETISNYVYRVYFIPGIRDSHIRCTSIPKGMLEHVSIPITQTLSHLAWRAEVSAREKEREGEGEEDE